MTLSRRNLLCQSMAAAVAFIGCSGRWALAQEPQRRREIVVNGKRVRTVDMHAHCHIPEATALASYKENFPGLVIGPERTKEMDEQGIDVEALSINPNFWDKLDRDLQAQIVKLQNEKLAELCTKEPERFVGLGSVTLAHPDLAVEQLEYGVKRLGLRGALVGGSINGVELSDRRFDPFWAKAEALGVVVFIHPQGTPELEASGRLKGNGVLGNTIGNPLETTIALSHLIFEGTLDRYPEAKILGAHAGGYLPSYIGRSDKACETFPQRCTVALKRRPSEYLRQLHFDSMTFTAEGLRHLIAEVGASQIVMGTDHPFPWTKIAVDAILNQPGLNDDDRVAMLSGNAFRLLGMKA